MKQLKKIEIILFGHKGYFGSLVLKKAQEQKLSVSCLRTSDAIHEIPHIIKRTKRIVLINSAAPNIHQPNPAWDVFQKIADDIANIRSVFNLPLIHFGSAAELTTSLYGTAKKDQQKILGKKYLHLRIHSPFSKDGPKMSLPHELLERIKAYREMRTPFVKVKHLGGGRSYFAAEPFIDFLITNLNKLASMQGVVDVGSNKILRVEDWIYLFEDKFKCRLPIAVQEPIFTPNVTPQALRLSGLDFSQPDPFL